LEGSPLYRDVQKASPNAHEKAIIFHPVP
jgi:hypothetical protein